MKRKVQRMNFRIWIASVWLLPVITARAQVTITAADMFNEAGLSYSAYANKFDPHDPSTSFSVGNLMGAGGGPQLWDFTTGPTDQIFQYDYLAPTGIAEASDFPQAKIAERRTITQNGEVNWLFFEQVPGVGRKVYGFYDPKFSAEMPSSPFSTPIVDFPAQINYKDTWTTSATFATIINVVDPEVMAGFPARITFSSTFTVDAFGVVDLPELGFGDALRINEEETIAIAIDLDGQGQFQNIETDFTRNYYWLSSGRGIVAQMNSIQSSTPPAANFDRATAFVRMFKTNKKAVAGCSDAGQVTDLKISVSNGKILLKWTKTQCAKQYRVEYSTSASPTATWKALGDPTANTFMLDDAGDQLRFYRVVSLR
jgi:hypothetical protein